MLRVYSILYLEQVWARPEEQQQQQQTKGVVGTEHQEHVDIREG
jgi:hypothetical protein